MSANGSNTQATLLQCKIHNRTQLLESVQANNCHKVLPLRKNRRTLHFERLEAGDPERLGLFAVFVVQSALGRSVRRLKPKTVQFSFNVLKFDALYKIWLKCNYRINKTC